MDRQRWTAAAPAMLQGVLAGLLMALLVVPPALHAQQAPAAPPADDAATAPAATEQARSEQATAQQTAAAGERKNDQRIVIGAGFGGHAFAQPEHAGPNAILVVNSSAFTQFYGEWYALDTIGFGVRLHGFGQTVTSTTTISSGGQTVTASAEADLSAHTVLLTGTWVPLGGRRYVRLGVVGGVGRASYAYTETLTPGGVTSLRSSGPAVLVGAYVDWGADGIGGRAGMQYLAMDLDTASGIAVDASGRDVFVDLRWAF